MATEQQIPKLAGGLVEHQSAFDVLSGDDAQWVITNTKEAIALMCDAIRNRVVKPAAQAITNLIQAVGEMAFPGATNFVASEKFVKDISDTATVKISDLGSNFTTWFLGKVEATVAPSTIGYGKLLKFAKAVVILAFLGGETKAETSLAEIFHLISLQANGKVGALLTNGWANIFFVRDASGVLRVVDVYWSGGGWCVRASEASYAVGWRGGHRVFSRKLAA